VSTVLCKRLRESGAGQLATKLDWAERVFPRSKATRTIRRAAEAYLAGDIQSARAMLVHNAGMTQDDLAELVAPIRPREATPAELAFEAGVLSAHASVKRVGGWEVKPYKGKDLSESVKRLERALK